MTALADQVTRAPTEGTRSSVAADDLREADAEQADGGPELGWPQMPTLISVTRAAVVLGISRASAYRYAACGDLPTVRLGGRLYIVSARLRAFLESA
jgi:hypothetical protein